ncbi:hypothetical protein [Actinomadura harenae]|uniref:Secreted protein n=1 Tax=Actinomadura harenae TaxID=2483351 RepID=A0A3M2MC18_9ACTN|nr:hypothetical protein [Actinomadura harenae]RMI46175.1 hypothetical protein EBO15_08150 [Actinomadura harenae]
MKLRLAAAAAMVTVTAGAGLITALPASANSGGGCGPTHEVDGMLVQVCISSSGTSLQASVYTREDGHNSVDMTLTVVNTDTGQTVGNAGKQGRIVDTHQGSLVGPWAGVPVGHYSAHATFRSPTYFDAGWSPTLYIG